MKYLASLALLFLLVSCTGEKKNASFLNATNLVSTFIKIKSAADTTIRLPKRGIIKIEKGTFDYDVELEVKEAYSMRDILIAGLITESNGQPLQSGGMIYINTKGDNAVKLNKPIDMSIPTDRYIEQMKLYKGQENGGIINWLERPAFFID